MKAADRQRPCHVTPQHIKAAVLGVLLVGGAYSMALATAARDYAWLGWLSLIPLLASIRSYRPLGAALAGAAWGLCLYLFSFAAGRTGVLHSLLSLLLLTTIPAAYALLGSLLTRRIGFSPLVLGVSWMGVELVLEPLGLRGGLLAATQGDGTLVHWVGSALGYVLAAFVLAYANSLLLLALTRVRVGLAPSQYPAGPEPHDTRLKPQTFPCFPLFVIPSPRPRAPPA